MAKYGSPISGGSFSGIGDYMNILNMHKLSSEIQNKKNADSDLKEKLEKYGFKKQ
ncbi:MAG: hypothetical protein M1308_07420 [Actinobacteria bacterium]|nr:hypothetical protein [Actinomycetota bacterium]